MDKKYQVFISSTYKDLIEVRRDISQSVLKLTEIPAAMEDFGSINKAALIHIKRVIDRCDYYILVIAGRYGSYDDTGVSFTEQEYDYAVEKGKTILVFIKSNIDSLPSKDVDHDPIQREKLDRFRTKVSDPNRHTVTFWDEPETLQRAVIISLSNAFRETPGIGWIRADTVDQVSIAQRDKEIALQQESIAQRDKEIALQAVEIRRLEYENEQLRSELKELKLQRHNDDYDVEELLDLHNIKVSWYSNQIRYDRFISLSWLEIFKIYGSLVKRYVFTFRIRDQFNLIVLSQLSETRSNIGGSYIEEDSHIDIETYFMGSDLIEMRNDEQMYLTAKGRKLIAALKSKPS